ncbi:MAG: lipoyl(octanoyl) transferase LipB [Alphaproteobacteria bacterium]|nr:lipoyl(octanoyl) transferase LipB [Alphaproteobacteria bacterium]
MAVTTGDRHGRGKTPEAELTVRPIGWAVSDGLVDYTDAVAAMERRVAEIAAGTASELVWLLQHPPLYTAGTSAKDADLIDPDRFPVFRTGRGGQFTYHGPGQRVVYVMLDLKRRKSDVRAYVQSLESWIIATLAELGVEGDVRPGRIGVWVARPDQPAGREDKIAAIGIRVRRWVAFHGLSLNVAPELEHFAGIVPCGITGHGVTSLADLGQPAEMSAVDRVLMAQFAKIFGDYQFIPEPAPL